MSLEADRKMTRELPAWLKPTLEFGPILAFLVTYLALRNESFVIGGVAYSGFVAVSAGFIPVFLGAMGALWALTGGLTRLQVVTTGMLVVFGGLGALFNDPSLFKMKPTAIYLLLTAILGIGLLRGQSWLKLILDEVVPLKKKGWMILTKRVTALCFLSAVANEVVWRTQSEAFWVIFETVAMPAIVLLFCLFQVRLFVDYATWGKRAKNP